MQDELSESDVERRRQAPVADAPEANTVSPMSNPTAESGPKAQAIGNQGVQDALSGNGLGAFSPVIAAEMMMAHAGIDPSLLGSDSNSHMQTAMKAGGDAGQPGIEQAMGALTGGGPLPEAAMNRIQTATGGTMGPLSGIPGTQPGMPRHYVDTAGAGITSHRERSTDARDQGHKDPGSVEQVFGAMASMTDNELDSALHQAGRSLLTGLDHQGVQDIVSGIGGEAGTSQQGPTSDAERAAAAQVKGRPNEGEKEPSTEPVAPATPKDVHSQPSDTDKTPVAPPSGQDPLARDVAAVNQGLPKTEPATKTEPPGVSDPLKAFDAATARPRDTFDQHLTMFGRTASHIDPANPNKAGIQRGTDAASTLVNVARLPGQVGQLTDGKLDLEDGKAVAGLAKTGIDTAKLVTGAADASHLGRASKAATAAVGLMNAPGQVGALMDGNWDKRDAEAAVGLGKTALDTTEAAGRIADYVSTKRAAETAFQKAAPGVSESMLGAASRAAADSAIGGANSRTSKDAIGKAMDRITANSTLATEMGEGGRSAARLAQNEASKAASTAAKAAAGTSKLAEAGAMASTLAKGSGSMLGKAGARFVPGMNAAVAALDTKNAWDTMNDPKASTTSKVTSVLTAAGSIAAATNIPVVSQVGAAVSTVSSLIGAIWG